MNINKEHNYGITPTVNIPRSAFLMKPERRTTFDAGLLIPIYINQDIMPGDTFSLDFTGVIRQLTPICPTMDNAIWDIYAFFQRSFNLWKHFKEFMGENPNGAWTDNAVEYIIPQMKFGYVGGGLMDIRLGDILNYMGIPLFSTNTTLQRQYSISALPYRMYVQIWNNFFRNQNVQAPMKEYDGDADTFTINNAGRSTYNWLNPQTTNGYSYVQPDCAPTCRLADYFSCAAIQPQKGNAVTLPLGSTATVWGNGKSLGLTDGTDNGGMFLNSASAANTTFKGYYNLDVGTTASTGLEGLAADKALGLVEKATGAESGLYADLSTAVASTVNALRLSFATQKILERDIFGTRLFEIYKNFFHVTSPYAVQQIPEYLGGCRVSIEQTQVAQTSSTDSTSPQGNVAAYSLTATNKHLFTKSFTEHGILMILMTVRTRNSYDQGIARQWSRKRRLDYYWPQLANLGYQAIKNKEIYADGSSNDEEIFGYCPHWDELRAETNINTGLFSGSNTTPLNFWHYGDHYNTLPTLSAEWMISPAKTNIGRSLAVQNQHQYMLDALLTINCARPIGAYSVPGLIDHF